MTNKKPTKELQFKLMERFIAAAEHAISDLGIEEHELEEDTVFISGKTKHMQEKHHLGGLVVSTYDEGFHSFSVTNYSHYTNDKVEISDVDVEDVSNLSITNKQMEQLTYNDLKKMVVTFADILSQISKGKYDIPRAHELIEGHYLNAQEQKAAARDRANLLIQRLEAP